MKRYQEDLPRILRKHRMHLRRNHNWPVEPVTCICDLQAGRFRKSHPLSCNNAHCFVCHSEKLMGIPTKQDRIRSDRIDEQLAELQS